MSKFTLPESFIAKYQDLPVNWGYGALSETVFLRSYSQLRSDGTKERWWQTCRRVIEAMFTIQREHCHKNKLPWNQAKAQRSAKDAYERMFMFKWTPPGRGLARMGTPIVDRIGSMALNNCSAVTTEDFVGAMEFLMDASLLGVGVGYDTAAAGRHTIHQPKLEGVYVIPDSREGWVEATRKLLLGYIHGEPVPEFDYSVIRPEGSPISSGGIAPGAEPLRVLHGRLHKLFSGRAGESLTISDVVDVGNMIGACVVSGGNRRTALIAIDDSMSDEFLSLKDYTVNPYRQEWGWASNNSIAARVAQDISTATSAIALNGEPGVVYPEMAQKYGRLIDPPDFKDREAKVPNPCGEIFLSSRFDKDEHKAGGELCVTGDTWVSTVSGLRQVDDLVGTGKVLVVVDGEVRETTEHGFFQTGRSETITLDVEGVLLTCTPDHQVMTPGGWIPAGDLKVGDFVTLSDNRGAYWDGAGTDSEGYLLGLLVGDGSFTPEAALYVFEDDSLEEAVNQAWEDVGIQTHKNFRGWQTLPDGARKISAVGLTRLAERFGIVRGHKTVTKQVMTASSDFQRGFLRGLFDADAAVRTRPTNTNPKKGGKGSVSVTLYQSDVDLLNKVQTMLLRLGVKSVRYLVRAGGQRELVWGVSECKDAYAVQVSSGHLETYMENISFGSEKKRTKVHEEWAKMSQGPKDPKFTGKVRSITLNEEEVAVYDCTVPEGHAFVANGVVVHNCNLNDINMNRHANLDDFLKTVKVSFLFNKTVTLIPTHNEMTNAIILKNRRIGASLGGVADFIDRNGMPEFRKWANAGYQATQGWDKTYSEWLCVRESIRLTSLKPSGTTSTLCGESPGVHWNPGGSYYIRRVGFTKGDPVLNALKAAGYRTEQSVSVGTFEVVEFPVASKARRSDLEVSAFEKMAVASEVQAWWADNAVSCTVSFDPETEASQIGHLLQMFDGKIKGISFLPRVAGGAYQQMPYEPITVEQYLARVQDLAPLDLSALYDGTSGDEAEGEKFCNTDVCALPETSTEVEVRVATDEEVRVATDEEVRAAAARVAEKWSKTLAILAES